MLSSFAFPTEFRRGEVTNTQCQGRGCAHAIGRLERRMGWREVSVIKLWVASAIQRYSGEVTAEVEFATLPPPVLYSFIPSC